MKQAHPALWAAGFVGAAIGTALIVIGVSGSGELAGLASGYGTMTVASAVYLLAGLKLRERFSRRARTSAASSISASGAVSTRP